MATAPNTKKYIVRTGFMVVQTIKKPDGSTFTRTTDSGEEIALGDDEAKDHAHKLEFANQKDRDAALAAEQQARVQQAATNSPAELVSSLIAALGQALQSSQPVPAAPPA